MGSVSMSGNHTLAPIALALHVKYQVVVIPVLMFVLAARPLKNAKFAPHKHFPLYGIYKVFDLTGV